MSLANNLMGLGMSPLQASALGFIGTEVTGLTATGSTSADALQLASGVSQMSTVAASTGVILPASGGLAAVINNGANTLTVYPGAGRQINNGTVSTGGYSIAAGKTALFITAGGVRWIATLST